MPQFTLTVMSNSRVTDCMRDFLFILYILESIYDGGDSFGIKEIQRWYLAARQLLLEAPLSEARKLRCAAKLMYIQYNASNLLKYNVLEQVGTRYSIALYGDEGWQKLFPDFYRGFLKKNEMTQVLNDPQTLLLLINNNFTYLDCSGSIANALAQKTPCLSWRAVTKTSKLKGLDTIEYETANELFAKLAKASLLFNDNKLMDAVREYQTIMQSGEREVADYIFNDKEYPADGGAFGQEYCNHEILLRKEISVYLDKHRQTVEDTLNVILGGQRDLSKENPVDFAPTWMSKPFCQRLWQLIQQEKANPSEQRA